MKKLMCACAALVLAVSAQAADALITKERAYASEGCMRDWTPLCITICGPVGLPWGFWDVKGLHVGFINSTYQFSGLQIGGINMTERAYGVQIGFINIIAADDCPFLPLVNWSF